MPVYLSRKEGDSILCGCVGCGLHIYGEIITLTISGVVGCGCVGGIEFTSITLPSVWVMTWNGTTWLAPNAGTASVGICGEAPFETASFNAGAVCAPDRQELIVAVTLQAASPINVYLASFFEPATSQPNLLLCGDPGVLMGDGNGSI